MVSFSDDHFGFTTEIYTTAAFVFEQDEPADELAHESCCRRSEHPPSPVNFRRLDETAKGREALRQARSMLASKRRVQILWQRGLRIARYLMIEHAVR